MRRLAVLLTLIAPAVAVAQPPPPPPIPLSDPDDALRPRSAFALAVQLLGNGQPDEAIPLLEDALAGDPDALPVWLKLKEAYEAARRYDDAVALVEGRIAREGRSVPLLSDLGEAQYRAGRADEATRTWADALTVAPAAEMTYRTVANSMGALRLYAEAADVLDAGRQALGDDSLFLLERAHLYGLGLEYAAAIELYLQMLATQPELGGGVRSRLTRLLEGQGAPEVFASAVDRAVALDPLNRAYRELAAWLALERKDYDAALDAVRAVDRLEAEEGRILYGFAVQAGAAGASDAAARAFDEILERHPTSPVATAALLGRARLWDQRARDARESSARGATPAADAARDAYRQYLDAAPTSADAPAAALALAALLNDVYRDFEGAEARLGEAARGRSPEAAAQARLALGEVALRAGDLDAARDRFADVDETVRIGPLAEQARYELALLDFYEGFMFSALARAEALDENTAADAANDAIALRVTLSETLDQDAPPDPDADLTSDPLHVYARAALRHRRALAGEAIATLDTLDALLLPTHALGDESLFLRAAVLRQAGEPAAAVGVLDRLAERFPLSFFRDRALRLQALAAEHDLGDPAAAAARWEALLEAVPGSLFAPEARAELRRLRSAI